jgi:acyl-CoA synthetase (AMP-forming)/AMP-acid ligase II
VDRKKDMVITGGMNVYPREIEDVLIRHPEIVEAAVIGVADDHWGESLKAYVVTKSGQSLLSDELMAFCADKLAKFKIPRDFVHIETLPRNAGGKILKTILRKQSNKAD